MIDDEPNSPQHRSYLQLKVRHNGSSSVNSLATLQLCVIYLIYILQTSLVLRHIIIIGNMFSKCSSSDALIIILDLAKQWKGFRTKVSIYEMRRPWSSTISVWQSLHKTNIRSRKTPRRAVRLRSCETFDPEGSQRTITFANRYYIHTLHMNCVWPCI